MKSFIVRSRVLVSNVYMVSKVEFVASKVEFASSNVKILASNLEFYCQK